jgi:hypothetical protein
MLIVEYVLKKLEPMCDGLAVLLLDGREVRRWALNFVDHAPNIAESIGGVLRLEGTPVKGST